MDGDIFQSLSAQQTVCQITRPDVEVRLRRFANGSAIPVSTGSPAEAAGASLAGEDSLDLETHARDQITRHIGQKFRGHELTRLVDYVLQAQGYQTYRSPAGPDGGVDIIAGSGPMGFDPPRLCVQVKSNEGPVDVAVLRELQGVMRNLGAQHGLLVAWGGFKSSVLNEARRLFFEIRLWDAGTLVEQILAHYPQLPAEFQAELPLQRIWALVPEE